MQSFLKVFSFLILFFPFTLFAQNMDIDKVSIGQKKYASDLELFDQALYRVYYDYSFKKNPKKDKSTHTLLLLKIGAKNNGFMDYYGCIADSVGQRVNEGKLSSMEAMGIQMQLLKKKAFDLLMVFDHTNHQITTQEEIGLSQYQYKEEIPQIQWNLVEGDSIFSGFECKKAIATFRGRNYVAWYSEEVPLPYGPYKFGGLPGLIFSIYDVNMEHVFTLAGLEEVKDVDPIYLKQKSNKYTMTTREKALQMNENYHADPAWGLVSTGRVTIAPEDLATIKPLPFNPIELE